jgi:hypothetical protein
MKQTRGRSASTTRSLIEKPALAVVALAGPAATPTH